MTAAPHDEQTETDELHKLIEAFDKFPEQGSMSQYVFEERVRAWSRQQTARLFDEIYELSPTKQFKDWKPQDAVTFYERLKALEALRVGLEGSSDD